MNSSSQKQNPTVPFFARFLESQEAEPRAAATLKYPSDRDEWWDIAQAPEQASDANTLHADASNNRATLKYPSDRDEWWDAVPMPEATSAARGSHQTLKYPSDRDED
ncbi:MAG TPA: microviridin/marinostatin family tricyclic proteinase inhibitor [Pyrinomonadaceae bacterium]|nr:microviridin/marinostatin family tricyclic proteinase inhibitor [Pyrinomonadaceae bacterium]